jgi:ERCC4-type nuclease
MGGPLMVTKRLDLLYQALPTGDYTVRGFERELCIERKATVTEIAQNVTKDRFLRELDRMLEYKYRYLICEFDIPEVLGWPHNSPYLAKIVNKIRVNPQFIMSSFAMMQVEYGINVIFCSTRFYAECCAVNIMKRISELGKE